MQGSGSCRGALLASPLEFPQRGNSRSEKLFALGNNQMAKRTLTRIKFSTCCSKHASPPANPKWGRIYFLKNNSDPVSHKMNLVIFRANGGFSQSMLSGARESKRGNIWTARMFEPVLATADGRVPQLPSSRKTFGVKKPT